MNYLKLMSILSEADADEYGVATQKKKKDEKDDFHRSKADQAFKDMHKVDVATEKDFETLGPITTKQHGDHKGNPSSINIGDATQQSPLKKFDMGGIGKSSYRKIDKTEGQKAMPKVDDGATKVLRIKEGSNFDATKFGMPKPGEKRWKQTSLSPQEAAAKHGKENVRVQKGRLRNGDDMVEVHVESVEEGYEATSEKSQFGGHRAHLKNPKGKTAYLGSTGYKNPEHAKGEAQAYHDAYFGRGGRGTNERAASNAVFDYRQNNKQHIVSEEAEIDEAVGTAAKYAHKKGIFGGKYGAKDHYLNVGYKTALNYAAQRHAQRKAEHEKQDPRMAKKGYTQNMVDAQKAKKKAKERGVTMPKLKGVNYAEEVEQLDELSPDTLNSYATKAQPDVRRQSLDAAKRKRRAKGVALARFKAMRGSK